MINKIKARAIVEAELTKVENVENNVTYNDPNKGMNDSVNKLSAILKKSTNSDYRYIGEFIASHHIFYDESIPYFDIYNFRDRKDNLVVSDKDYVVTAKAIEKCKKKSKKICKKNLNLLYATKIFDFAIKHDHEMDDLMYSECYEIDDKLRELRFNEIAKKASRKLK